MQEMKPKLYADQSMSFRIWTQSQCISTRSPQTGSVRLSPATLALQTLYQSSNESLVSLEQLLPSSILVDRSTFLSLFSFFLYVMEARGLRDVTNDLS
jgi:hypothetical protein